MTDEIHIPCPQCRSVLRLRNRKLLGRKGKCPKCATRFLLDEPTSQQPDATDAQTTESTRPTWMGSESDSSTKLATPPAKSIKTQNAKRKTSTKQKQAQQKQTEPAPSPQAPVIQTELQNEFTGIGSLETSTSGGSAGVGRLHDLKKRQKKQHKFIMIAGGVLAVLVFIASLWMMQNFDEHEQTQKKSPIKNNEEYTEHQENLKHQTEVAKSESPTQGKPIPLSYLPAGCQLLINVHPAVFWEENSKGQEFRFCFGANANTWLAAKLKELCKYDPAEIDEVLIGGILGPEGSVPEFAAVVHLKQKQNKQDMVKMFDAEESPDFKNYPVYTNLNGDRSYLIIDQKTFVSSPTSLINESVDMSRDPLMTNPTPVGIEELLMQTDRQRHFTIIFEAKEATIQKQALIPKSVHPVWDEFVLWMGEDVETFAWSWHLGEEEFHSEILLRNQFIRKTTLLHEDYRKKINRLPYMVLGAVKQMNPQVAGPRKIIGRLPAMLKAFSMATKGGTGKRYLQLTTHLPERAAPNLAIGTVLAWDESTRTDFTTKPTGSTPAKPTSELPSTVIGRLRMEIEIDFRNTPLQEAFAYIAEETKTEIIIDGDALKLSGFTKNMPQTFAIKKTPAIHAIAKILSQRGYELMRVVLDEKEKKIYVSTKAACEDQKLTTYDIAAELKKK